jgi:hypothetical protein
MPYTSFIKQFPTAFLKKAMWPSVFEIPKPRNAHLPDFGTAILFRVEVQNRYGLRRTPQVIIDFKPTGGLPYALQHAQQQMFAVRLHHRKMSPIKSP